MKIVWFVSHYSMPPEYEMRVKTQSYSNFLNTRGYKTIIFSSSIIHNSNIDLIPDNSLYIKRNYDGLDFVHIKCIKYTGNGIRRFINMQEFAFKFPLVAKEFKFPDVIVADVNCINYWPIYKFCKRNKIPLYIDMRDLWPMSIVEYYKKFTEKNLIIKYLYYREHKMYRRVTGVIFSMPGGEEYLKDKGWQDIDKRKIYYINNGVNIKKFNSDLELNTLNDPDLEQENLIRVVYTGSLRIANNIQSIVDAAQIIQYKKLSNIIFLIYGDGEEKAKLQLYCKINNIKNIKFKGMVHKKFIPFILSKCDIGIVNYQNSKTLKYGGSQNKLFEYMIAGLPILLTVKMNYNLVSDNKLGLTLDYPSAFNIADGIEKLCSLSIEERLEIKKRSLTCVNEYDYNVLSNKLINIIDNR